MEDKEKEVVETVEEEVKETPVEGTEEVKETEEFAKEVSDDETYMEEDESEKEEDDKDDEEKSDKESDEKEDEEDMACKKKKYEELEAKYSALEKSYAELEAKLESMADYAELKAFKDAYDAEQYKAKVDAISKEFGLAEKDFKDIREKAYAKEISLENYEEKLALISYRQNAKKNFGAEKEKNEAMIIDSTDTEEISIYGELDKYFK